MASLSKKTISVKLLRKQVIKLVEITLQSLNLRIIETDKKRGFFQAKKRMSFKSWGEKIQLEIYDDLYPNINGSIVHIRSRSSLRTTIEDWGTNDKNVYQIEQFLRKLAKDYISELKGSNEEKEEKHTEYNAEYKFKEKEERKFLIKIHMKF